MRKYLDIKALNNLLTIAYNFGWRVGRSWDPDWRKNNCTLSGYLNDDPDIDEALFENARSLLESLKINTKHLHVYTKEDNSTHENDWDYVAPIIEIND